MKEINGMPARELRCQKCRAFITYERIYAGYIYHRCPKCGFQNEFTFKFMNSNGVRDTIDTVFKISPKGGAK